MQHSASNIGESRVRELEGRAEEAEFGFWLYLMSDAVLFGLLFATFAVMINNTAGGPGGSELFDLASLSIQTGLLLSSTLSMALSHHAAQRNAVAGAIAWLVLTGLLGACFLVLELAELSRFIAQDAGPGRSGYLSSYFMLVGTHGLHVAVGLLWALVMIVQFAVKGVTIQVLSRFTRLALFWHFLDIVWIGVYSLVYLPRL